jgi:tRNA dimethylallyltransferase
MKMHVPVILGPTAVGKTAIGIQLASDFGLEIISCDSRQIYRGMDIGTAKTDGVERCGVRQWLIDICDPPEYYSAYRFARDARAILKKNDAGFNPRMLILGGTGLYFHALQNGLWPEIESEEVTKEHFVAQALSEGNESVYRELQKIDPESAARLHPNDLQRVIRALQVFRKTGRSIIELQKDSKSTDEYIFDVIKLSMPRHLLYARINERVDAMCRAGLWDEFCGLREKGYGSKTPGMQCVGYKELFAVENNELTFDGAVENIKRNTRRYAKRQTTWFAHKVNGVEIDVSHARSYGIIKENIEGCLSAQAP